MTGRFDGLNDEQWSYFQGFIEQKIHKVGRPLSSTRTILNTILYVLITGCRWCDIPVGENWGRRSTAHERLGMWSKNGTLEKILRAVQRRANELGAIDWERGSVDGSFSPWKRRR